MTFSRKYDIITSAALTAQQSRKVLPCGVFISAWRCFMKKLVCALLSLLLIFALTACNISIVIQSPGEKETETDSETVAAETKESDGPAQSDDGNDGFASLEHIDNGVLKKAEAQTMSVPQNMKFLKTEEATEDTNSIAMTATVVLYSLDGEVVSWTTENDFIYIITSGNNRLVVIDSQTMSAVFNTPLAGEPAEMNILGDKIYISLPDLCRIDVFSKFTCEKESSVYFDHEISSFCFDENYIYYTEHDQFCKVFRKNILTNELTQIQGGIHNTFYSPKIYLNKEDRILYIGESKYTGSALYYYDADTLTQKSVFKKNNYGLLNYTREIFHIGDDIFWGSYRLSDTNAKEIIGRYGVSNDGSMVLASEDLVSTHEGLFLTDTYECVVNYKDSGFGFEYVLVSDSYNIFFRQRIANQNVILGINFELQ